MDEFELMMHLHHKNKRQGSGSEEATNLAISLAKIDNEILLSDKKIIEDIKIGLTSLARSAHFC